MTEWVSQAEAVRLLKAEGDDISQPALSQYLKGHPEVPRETSGAGKAQRIDFGALKKSRGTRNARGPSSAPLLNLDPPPAAEPETRRGGPNDELAARRSRADTDRAEFDARLARIRAEEAEGRLIPAEVAVGAFRAAGVALLRSLEENRRGMIDEIRAAADPRAADLAARAYELRIRTGFGGALAQYADQAVQPADPAQVAAE